MTFRFKKNLCYFWREWKRNNKFHFYYFGNFVSTSVHLNNVTHTEQEVR